jgi:hypothetical protein
MVWRDARKKRDKRTVDDCLFSERCWWWIIIRLKTISNFFFYFFGLDKDVTALGTQRSEPISRC